MVEDADSTSRAAALAGRLALAAISLGVALMVAELGLRLILPPAAAEADGQEERPGFIAHDAELGWLPVAGGRGVMHGDEFDVTVTINEQGLRGPRTYPRARRPGIARIVVIGDSFSFGYGVRDEENWITRIEQALPATEVINLAVTGYGTDQQLLRLEADGFGWTPDLVVVALFEGNVFRNARLEQVGYPKPRFVIGKGGALELVGVPVPESPAPPGLFARSALGRVLGGRGSELVEHLGFGEAWPVTRAILARMRSVSAAAGAELVALVIPKDQAVHGAGLRRTLHERTLLAIDRMLGDLAIPYLDLTPVLAAAGSDTRLYFYGDGHWNAAGHAVAATAASDFLREHVGAQARGGEAQPAKLD